ncbi:MAG TPA: 2-phospho-L-lactate guanylyltransferase [Methanocorpusculum sp.]|nr:2-phospho-L-lactate guanylyltransferase [Methanocorpusculum sp.]
MRVQALIPFRPVDSKKRLSPVFSQREREDFARAMIADVISSVKEAGCIPVVLSTSAYSCADADVEVRVVEQGLNEALNEALPQCSGPVVIIMSDLPLVRASDLARLLGTKKDLAIVPGLGGGTNIIFVKEPARFHVLYYGYSFAQHLRIAKESGLSVEVIDSMRMSVDADEPEDLVELLIHGTGAARAWLDAHGFSLSTESGRLKVMRGGEVVV